MENKYFKYCEDDILEILIEHLAKKNNFGTFSAHAKLIDDNGRISFVAVIGKFENREIDCVNLQKLYKEMDYNGSHGGKDYIKEQIEELLDINLNILVQNDEIADALYLQKICDGKIEKGVPYFDMWNSDALTNLIQYMKSNNLSIAPGRYVINQKWGFENGYVIIDGKRQEILKFIPLK